jgi:shikimate dehydrogenase
MSPPITGATAVAAVIGRPVRHSLSPLIHNAWLAAAGLDGVYVALSPREDRLPALVEGLRGGALRGLNVTLPFKEAALALADTASQAARRAGAANLLLFGEDGSVAADNTDGVGLVGAFASQAPAVRLSGGPVVVLGAGGAARAAAAALMAAGAPQVRLINRTRDKAAAIRAALGERVAVFDWTQTSTAFDGAAAVINATSLGLEGKPALAISLDDLPAGAAVMDMVYRPLRTPLLIAAAASGRPTVDGLEMLIQQAIPSFTAFFGQPPPASVDVRALALSVLEPGISESKP